MPEVLQGHIVMHKNDSFVAIVLEMESLGGREITYFSQPIQLVENY